MRFTPEQRDRLLALSETKPANADGNIDISFEEFLHALVGKEIVTEEERRHALALWSGMVVSFLSGNANDDDERRQ